MPIKKLACLKCPYTVEITEIDYANFGVNGDILKHIRIQHSQDSPRLGRDYKIEDMGLL